MGLECDEWNETAPPVGEKCEAMHLPNLSIPVECIILDWKSVAIESPAGWSVLPILHGTKFRKLRTEREKFIDAVKRFRNVDHVIDADAYFGGLYDAGFRAPDNK